MKEKRGKWDKKYVFCSPRRRADVCVFFNQVTGFVRPASFFGGVRVNVVLVRLGVRMSMGAARVRVLSVFYQGPHFKSKSPV